MGSVRVDLDALVKLKQRCQDMSMTFDDAGHDLIMGLTDQVGTDALHGAFGEFEAHWSDGRAKVKRHLDGLVERLTAAIDQYEHTEADLVGQIQQSTRGES